MSDRITIAEVCLREQDEVYFTKRLSGSKLEIEFDAALRMLFVSSRTGKGDSREHMIPLEAVQSMTTASRESMKAAKIAAAAQAKADGAERAAARAQTATQRSTMVEVPPPKSTLPPGSTIADDGTVTDASGAPLKHKVMPSAFTQPATPRAKPRKQKRRRAAPKNLQSRAPEPSNAQGADAGAGEPT